MLLAVNRSSSRWPNEEVFESGGALPHHRRRHLHRRRRVRRGRSRQGHRRGRGARITERGATRADDRTEAAMEDRKREGYF
jgi:hypothetical protein